MRSRSRRQRVRNVQLAGHELEPFNIHHHLALYTAQGLQAQAKFKATLPPEKKKRKCSLQRLRQNSKRLATLPEKRENESAACKGSGKIYKKLCLRRKKRK